jgi:hypothetical protein
MNSEDIKKYLQMLGQELQKKQVAGEILVADDVVLLLDVRKPGERQDLDAYISYLKGEGAAIERQRNIKAYFRGGGPAIRDAAASIADHAGLPGDWLDVALKQFSCTQSLQEKWLEYPGLRIYLSPVDYMLAMKVATASSPQDIEDIKLLAQKLHIVDAENMLTLIAKYIPEQLLTPARRLYVEQAFAA